MMFRSIAVMICLSSPPASVAQDTDEPVKAFSPEDTLGDLAPKPTAVPYRPATSELPISGAHTMPEPPQARSNLPGWVQRSMGIENEEVTPTPPSVPSGDIVEPEITAENLPEEGPRPEPLSEWEITVWGDRVEHAKREVNERLTALGYAPTIMNDGRTLWRPTAAKDSWKPRVIIDDDGWFTLRTPTISGAKLTLNNGAIQPGPASGAPGLDYSPPIVGPGIGGQFAGKRVIAAAEARITRQIWDVVQNLSIAQQDEALAKRLSRLPDELDALWLDGQHPDGYAVPTSSERVSALLDLWATRTRTRAGETVRQSIANYIEAMVAPTVEIPEDEIFIAEAKCGCSLRESDIGLQ